MEQFGEASCHGRFGSEKPHSIDGFDKLGIALVRRISIRLFGHFVLRGNKFGVGKYTLGRSKLPAKVNGGISKA